MPALIEALALVLALELANARTSTSTHIREMLAEQFTQERQSRLTPLYVPSFRHSWKMMFLSNIHV